MDYPIWDIALGGSVLMAVVAITHVIVAHFAIGGGLVIVVTETLAVRRGDTELRELARRGSLLLILIATVFGAISGVGIWVVAGLISPAAISALIHTYVWGWAIEWTFFLLEIVAALIYYTTWGKISKSAHVLVGWIYVVSAYLSLVVINGIITFMLTPGSWLVNREFWHGFFNPTYWPSLLLRTGICLMMATVFLAFSALRAPSDQRPRLVRYLGWWLVGGAVISYAGYRWWEAALPQTVLRVFRGAEPSLPTLADTRSLTLWALAVVLVLAVAVMVALPRAFKVPVAVVTMVAGFLFFGGYERLREGVRKPFLIHSYIFSNGLAVADVAELNRSGVAARTGWVAVDGVEDPVAFGRHLFRVQCASCHTLDGYQSIRRALPTVADVLAVAADEPAGSGNRAFDRECRGCHRDVTAEEMRAMLPDPEDIRSDPGMIRDLNLAMIALAAERLRAMGEQYETADPGALFDTHQTEFPSMPPLVADDRELEALVAYLSTLTDQNGESPRLARLGGV